MKASLLVAILYVTSACSAWAVDCNGNGIEDREDISGSLSFSSGMSGIDGFRIDLNGDGLPDEFARTPQGFRVGIQTSDYNFEVTEYAGLPSGRPDRGPYVVAARCNANGFVDLIQTNSLPVDFDRPDYVVYQNDGLGTFGAGREVIPGECSADGVKFFKEMGVGSTLLFSSDSAPDRIKQLGKDSFELFVTTDTADESSKGIFFLPGTAVTNSSMSAAAFDFNRDGFNDLVIKRNLFESRAGFSQTISDQLFVFEGAAENQISQDSRIQLVDSQAPPGDEVGVSASTTYADINQDGYLDVLVRELLYDPGGLQGTLVSSPVFINATEPSSPDSNGNLVPDVCERAIPGDYDGDRRSNEVVVRPFGAGLDWYISNNQSNNPAPIQFGLSGFDRPAPGDFNGDQLFSPGVVRNIFGGLFWYYRTPDGEAVSRQWGLSGDIPLTGYFDADKTTDLAVVRNQGGFLFWYITPFEGSEAQVVQWGLAGDTPFTADWNGDGVDELVVARNERGGITWYVRSLDGSLVEVIQWGLSGDGLMKPADMDGDGKADLVVSRPSGILISTFIRFASGGSEVKTFGLSTDRTFVGYYGSHTGDLGVYRPIPFAVSEHFVNRQPSTRFRLFGLAQDIFVPPHGL